MGVGAWFWRAFIRRPPPGLVEAELSRMKRRIVADFAYGQAELIRDGHATREEALAAIAERFPELTGDEVSRALNRGLFESR